MWFRFVLASIFVFFISSCKTRGYNNTVKIKSTTEVAFVSNLKNESDFISMQRVVDGFSFVKFSNFFKEANSPMYFQNTAKFEFHMDFFRSALPKLQNLTPNEYELMLFDPTAQAVYAGAAYYAPEMEVAGIQGKGVLGFMHYYKGNFVVDDVAKVASRLKESAPFINGKLVYLFENNSDFFKNRNALVQKGIVSLPISRFLNQGVTNRVYNSAKSYGYLKFLTLQQVQDGDYSSKDIVLLSETPLDLNPVSGVITTQPQSPHSHIIFRAINMKIPCAFFPGADTQLKAAFGQLVEMETTVDNKITVRTAADMGADALNQAATAYFKSRNPTLPEIPLNLNQKNAYMLPQNAEKALMASYGAKGVNFAILDNALRSSNVDRSYFDGSLLLPMTMYAEHVNQKLTEKICSKASEKCQQVFAGACSAAFKKCSELAASSASVRDLSVALFSPANIGNLLANVNQRRGTLEFMRQAIRRTPMQSATKMQLQTVLAQRFQPSTKRIRMRSSTNAEDLEGLNGAGLYTSKAACLADTNSTSSGPSACMTSLEETRVKKLIVYLQGLNTPSLAAQIADLQEKLVDKDEIDDALRKVYASVWNEKAFLNRDYYGIDHQRVHMGVLVQPSFVNESANGVIVLTKVDDAKLQVSIVVQQEDISVTNPEIPGTMPEEWVVDASLNAEISRTQKLRSSTLAQNNILSDVQLQDITKQVAIIQKAMTVTHGSTATKRLDIEFIISENGVVLIKQARPL